MSRTGWCGSAVQRSAIAAVMVVGLAFAAPEGRALGMTDEVEVGTDSMVLVEGMPNTVGAWVVYNYATAIDCSPPPSCYANSQRVYYLVNCASGRLAQVQRISLDLNGGVVAQSEINYGAPWLRPLVNSREVVAWRKICWILLPRTPDLPVWSP
jgi:hypothetical protein